MDEWYPRISVARDTMELHKVQHFDGLVWSTPLALPGRCDIHTHQHSTSGIRRRKSKRRRHSTYWHMAQCEGVGWLLWWIPLMTKICDIRRRNAMIRSEIWTCTTSLGLVVRTHGPQWGGCGFHSPCRCGAHHHSPPNYDGGPWTLLYGYLKVLWGDTMSDIFKALVAS
jgi:hypothetical protein